jgi:hypothetical protein
MSPIHRVRYEVDGRFEGVILVDDDGLGSAMGWPILKLDGGWTLQVDTIADEEATAIPATFIGRMLDEDEAAELDRLLIARIPKKKPAPLVRRSLPGARRRA